MICLRPKPKLEVYSNCKGLSQTVQTVFCLKLVSLFTDFILFSVVIWLVGFESKISIFHVAC